MATRAGSLDPHRPISVLQLDPVHNPHLSAFDEVAASLVDGLRSCGFDATHVVGPPVSGRRNIVLGALALTDDSLSQLPSDTIIYNHEQIDTTSLLPPERLGVLAGLEVWDYSGRNVAAWVERGIEAAHVPIGWSPGLATLDRSRPRDIDVLFYGSSNERRQRVLDALVRKGVRLEAAFGVYDGERDDLIERARAVINIQYYEARILEMVRLSYLFANGVPVVSETAPGLDAPDGFDDAAAFASYEALANTTVALLVDAERLEAQGARGRACMEAWPWSRALVDVIESPTRKPTGPPPDGEAGRTVTLVCGVPQGDAGSSEAREFTDSLLAACDADRSWLGPPLLVDAESASVAALRDRMRAWLGAGGEPARRVVDPALSLLVPFWSEVVRDVGLDVDIEIVVPRPDVGEPTIESTLAWLSHVLFAEALSRDLTRRFVVSGESVDVSSLPPSLRFAAMEMAVGAHAALSGEPDLVAVDEITERYLDAMAVYFPLLDRHRPGG